jgi:citrate lyase gamma subunit
MEARHKTIPFDPATHLVKSLKNLAFKAAYKALEDEFSALDALLQARKNAILTRAEACGKKLTIQIG